MDRKQPFLLVLLIVMFGVAVAAAVWVFGGRNVEARRDAILSTIQHIAADAYAWRRKPATMGGGGGSYERYAIPASLDSSELATYQVAATSSTDTLVILATAPRGSGTVIAAVGPDGGLTIRSFTGDFTE